MDLGILETMDAPELRSYLRFLLWHYRVVDGFWFLSVENKYGRPAPSTSMRSSGERSRACRQRTWSRGSP